MLVWLSPRLLGQAGGPPSTARGERLHYTGDIRGTRYSPLDQINASNFQKLEVAWRLKTDNLGAFPEFELEGTPLMVNGVLYTAAGTRRSVIALDPGSYEPSVYKPPLVGHVDSLWGAISAGPATNWPGGGYDPDDRGQLLGRVSGVHAAARGADQPALD